MTATIVSSQPTLALTVQRKAAAANLRDAKQLIKANRVMPPEVRDQILDAIRAEKTRLTEPAEFIAGHFDVGAA